MTPLDPRQFRQVLGHFLSGVTVVAVTHEGQTRGMTASAFTSLSLDPPLVLVCVGRKAHLHSLLTPDGRFSVSILAEDQGPVSNHFAGFAPDVAVSWDHTFGVTPVVSGALAWLDCAVHELVPGGDHTILIGRVERAASADGAPLAYHRGKYGRFVQNVS